MEAPKLIILYQSALSAGLLSTVATIRAPWLGGLDHSRRQRYFNWLRTTLAISVYDKTQHNDPARSSV